MKLFLAINLSFYCSGGFMKMLTRLAVALSMGCSINAYADLSEISSTTTLGVIDFSNLKLTATGDFQSLSIPMRSGSQYIERKLSDVNALGLNEFRVATVGNTTFAEQRFAITTETYTRSDWSAQATVEIGVPAASFGITKTGSLTFSGGIAIASAGLPLTNLYGDDVNMSIYAIGSYDPALFRQRGLRPAVYLSSSSTATGSPTRTVSYENTADHYFTSIDGFDRAGFTTVGGNANPIVHSTASTLSPDVQSFSMGLDGERLSLTFGKLSVFIGGSAIQDYQTATSYEWRQVASSTVSAVPEPESYAMLLAGLGLIGAAVKRRKSKRA